MRLILKQNAGFTLNNIPGIIFLNVIKYCMDGNNVILDFTSDKFNIIQAELNRVGTALDYNNSAFDADTIIVSKHDEVTPRPVEPARPENPTLEMPQNTAPTPQRVRPLHEVLAENIAADEAMDTDAGGSDVEEGEHIIIQNERNFSYTPVPEQEMEIFMAQKMKNNLTAQSNTAIVCLGELNKIMARALVLKTKIAENTRDIKNNPKIQSIITQLHKLETEDNLIESAKISKSDGYIWLKTKNIITDKLKDDTVRDIGTMLIKLNLTAMITESLGEEGTALVQIFNMTRHVKDDEMEYECGHVRYDGTVCLGSGFDPLVSAMSNCDLMMVVDLIIKFIKNPDIEDSWGKAATYFPEVHN